MRKLSACVGLFGVTLAQLVLASAAAAAPPGRALDATAVDSYMNDYLERTGLPGAVVAVTRGDQVIRAAGYGHGADGRTLTAGTPMPVASLSKSFTALAVMQLVEAGKVNLDAPVRHYLPEFEMADPRAGKITVRQLLNQTSGMADSTFPDLALPQSDTLAGAVARMRGAKLSVEPGTKMNYHNPNYFVAARLVEVVSGVPFADHMSGKVFGPLGMKASTTVDTTKDMPGGAKGYIRAYGQVIPRSHPYWFANGSQGVVTTADDLTRWLIMQNNKGRSAHGRQIVSTRSIETMQAPTKGSSYGMGWSTSEPEQGPVRIQHTGWLLTHNAMQTLLPGGGYGIAVVTNTGMSPEDDSALITQGLVDLTEGKTPEPAAPFTMTADLVLAALTFLALALGVLGVLRARTWAGRTTGRPLWRVVLRLVPYTLPIAIFAMIADLFGLLLNRAGTMDQITYVWPALYVWLGTTALAGAAVIMVRGFHTIRARRRPAGITSDGSPDAAGAGLGRR
ncbi:serine hydrolase domain-containing protein [Streptosporangium canum]|uniref:serine hydrolase domain-containing protein n=1 Tax=Streptosporangium canum TaxID=324952 RepID=UPI00341EE0BA